MTVFSVEIPTNSVGGMLEECVIPCNVLASGWRRSDLENLCGHPGCYIISKISTRQKEEKRVHWRFTPQLVCVQFSHPRPICTLTICTFWVIKEKEKRQIIFLYISIVVFLCYVVEGDLKAPFLIATTLRCRGGCDSFPWIGPLYPWSIPYNAEH